MNIRSRAGIIGAAVIAAVALAVPASAAQARPAVPAVTHSETSYVRTVVVTPAVAAVPAVVGVAAVTRATYTYGRTVVVSAAVPAVPAVAEVSHEATSDWLAVSPGAGWVAGASKVVTLQPAVEGNVPLWVDEDGAAPGGDYVATAATRVVPKAVLTQYFVRNYFDMTYTYVWAASPPAGGTISTSPTDLGETERTTPAHTEIEYKSPSGTPAVTETQYQWTGTVVDTAAVAAVASVPAVTRAELTGFQAAPPLGNGWTALELKTIQVTPAVLAAAAVPAAAAVTRVETTGWVVAVPAGDGWTVSNTRSVIDSAAIAAVNVRAAAALSNSGASGWVPLVVLALGLGLLGSLLVSRRRRG